MICFFFSLSSSLNSFFSFHGRYKYLSPNQSVDDIHHHQQQSINNDENEETKKKIVLFFRLPLLLKTHRCVVYVYLVVCFFLLVGKYSIDFPSSSSFSLSIFFYFLNVFFLFDRSINRLIRFD